MDPAVLAHQAVVAEEHGNPQLAENFLRAGRIMTIDDEEVMGLRAAASSVHRQELDALSARSRVAASRCAELVRQAAAVYARRGLLR